MLIRQELSPVYQLKIFQQWMNYMQDSVGSFFLNDNYKQAELFYEYFL